ncbi:MAG: family 43 glycosylhydrolase [Clostridia bacterium]|nr:family 43 glycosylhydrolase [Clostridia bacterium]
MNQIKATYCNPIQIEDLPSGRWLDAPFPVTEEDLSVPDFRSCADPGVIWHEGKWIMYPSYRMAYVSEDFVHWKHVDIGIPHLRYSPAVVHFRDKWYLIGHNMSEVYCSDSPLGPFVLCGQMKDVHGNEMKPLDGCYLADGDRLYFYWVGAEKPKNGEDVEVFTGTVGVELDPDRPWQCITEPVWLNRFDPSVTWQCTGENNQNKRMGWLEGQWAIKIGKRYFIMYSGAGTQYSTYATDVLYSDEGPLVGFKPQKRGGPLTQKRTGLLRGAGHGCIVEGPSGTYWAFYSTLYNFHHNYERRVGMDLVCLDQNGELYCPRMTETPQYVPGAMEDPEKENDTGWLPLTFYQRPTATSFVPGREPWYAVDDSVYSWWQPTAEDREKTIEIPLGSQTEYWLHSVRLLWRDIGMDVLGGIHPGAFQYVIEYRTLKDAEWRMLVDASQNTTDLCVDYRDFSPVRANSIRLRILGSPRGIEPGLVSLTAFGRCACGEAY